MARKSRSEQQPTHANSPPPNATNARKRKFDFDKGFEVRLVQPGKQQGKLQPPAKKRKLNDAAATSVKADVFQPNPFEGSDLSDAHYNVLPRGFWEHTDRYRSFTIEKATFAVNQIVFIKADRSQDTIPAHVQGWVAKILEVRASDPSHVFLRVYWLYRPEDLPRGRQPYHGASELIASNDMAIIDALTVESEATVIHWAEKADQGEVLKQDQLFWRQTYDVVKGGKLSELPEHCIEKSPCNPDDILVQCEACSSWLHGSCLEEDAVREAYKSHDIPFPEDQPKARGRPPKKGAKKRKSDLTAFSASIKNTTSGKTRLTVTDQRPDQGDHWNVAVKCLLCKATIEEALNEEETKPREPTPLFENQQQDVDATQDNIILGARPNDDDEDSVLGKSQEEPQESAAAPARDRTALNSAKDAPPKKENDWLSKMLQ